MFETLFGAEMPLAVRFFLAFLIVLGLIGATAWAVRRFGSGRLGGSSGRGRQPRLAVIDYASVDARRRLILVRRDNVEHLLMIGGPTDVVVESNIVRAAPAAREAAMPRSPAPAETLPRAIPLPDNGSNGSWPLQPEPMGPARPGPRMEGEPAAWPAQQHAESPPRLPRETLAALADEIATRPAPQRNRAGGAARPHSAEPRIPAPQAVDAETDQSLAEMAHRLEAALRKPKTTAESRAPAPAVRVAPQAEPAAEAEAAPPRAARPGEARLARAEAKVNQGKALYDSLEQEMASLLGRPAGKM
jgi:flagellar protein FliO/FliZ